MNPVRRLLYAAFAALFCLPFSVCLRAGAAAPPPV